MGSDQRDAAFHDNVALNEIELYGDVLVAVAASNRPFLTQEEIDTALGIRHGGPEGETG